MRLNLLHMLAACAGPKREEAHAAEGGAHRQGVIGRMSKCGITPPRHLSFELQILSSRNKKNQTREQRRMLCTNGNLEADADTISPGFDFEVLGEGKEKRKPEK